VGLTSELALAATDQQLFFSDISGEATSALLTFSFSTGPFISVEIS
jgi:hypothetical protein